MLMGLCIFWDIFLVFRYFGSFKGDASAKTGHKSQPNRNLTVLQARASIMKEPELKEYLGDLDPLCNSLFSFG